MKHHETIKHAEASAFRADSRRIAPMKKLDTLLGRTDQSALGRLAAKAGRMDALLKAVTAAVPDELAPGVVALNLRDSGELVLLCRSAAYASRVRFEADAIQAAAREAGFTTDRVVVRVSRDVQA